jgi:hypothetical protein
MSTSTGEVGAASAGTGPAAGPFGLRMVGASGAVCVDGVCSVDLASPSPGGTLEQS